MKRIDYELLTKTIKGCRVERPDRIGAGTLSGHAAGEPFEKKVYHCLKDIYPGFICKQYDFLNDIYRRNPQVISVQDRYALFNSPTAFFLLSRDDKDTRKETPEAMFEEKQNDTADILCHDGGFYELIDVKTRNIGKTAQPPNIISAYKLARTCAVMLDNNEFDTIGIHYVEVDWAEDGDNLRCTDVHHGDLFKARPESLYINWAAAMQVQFHVRDLDQSWTGSMEEWARGYIAAFVASAQRRCDKMRDMYITPFQKYLPPTP